MANYTRKAILYEFELMLKEMPFNRITVTELVKRTEISSNTFYYHFQDIYGLLEVWLAEKREVIIDQTKDMPSMADAIKFYYEMLKANSEIVYHIFNGVQLDKLENFVFVLLKSNCREFLLMRVPELEGEDKALKGLSEIFCYSLAGMTLEFVWGHMEKDIESMISEIYPIYENVINDIIAKSR